MGPLGVGALKGYEMTVMGGTEAIAFLIKDGVEAVDELVKQVLRLMT